MTMTHAVIESEAKQSRGVGPQYQAFGSNH
jgi:hypothetical protein